MRELSDLISLGAQLNAEDPGPPPPRAGEALWLASTAAITAGDGAGLDAAKSALRAGDPERGRARGCGRGDRRPRRHRPGARSARIAIDSGSPTHLNLADRADIPDGPNGGSGSVEKPKPAGYYEGESMTRRGVFMVAGQALGGVAAVGVLLPVVGFAVAPILETPEETWVGVGALDDFVVDSYRAVTLTIRSGIGEAGKTTAYVRKGSEDLNEDPTRSSRSRPGAPTSAAPSGSSDSAGTFSCPCHGGAYDFEGQVIGGPPVRPLDRFQTRVEGDEVQIGSRYSVTNELEPVRARDPGEFTGGIWEYLYPPRPSTPPAP